MLDHQTSTQHRSPSAPTPDRRSHQITTQCSTHKITSRIERATATAMDQLRISELNPDLAALKSKTFRAAVTLLWPYSSSQRQFALLLAEPDFRLRRKKGQVRARFSGSSAKAIATTGVGIGDEVILSLQGAQFVQEGAINTPGKSIDWELSYTQTIVVQVFRHGSEIASLEIVNVSPTPAPQSPIRRQPVSGPSPTAQWSSPAFLKRVRLSDGPFFDTPYDPLADENDEGHDKKRRRKSYRDWKAWTYNARTPSPEKGDDTEDEDFGTHQQSPSRAAQLPDTPISPFKPTRLLLTAGSHDGTIEDEASLASETEGDSHFEDVQIAEQDTTHDAIPKKSIQDEVVCDNDYYEPHVGLDELPSLDSMYAFGGDTEVDTEVNTEEEDAAQHELEDISMSSTEANTDDQEEDQLHRKQSDVIEAGSERSALESDDEATTSMRVEDSLIEDQNGQQETDVPINVEVNDGDRDIEAAGRPSTSGGGLTITMPPPILPTLQIDYTAQARSGFFTPIGREPASPTLQPQDSASLPLPSPFPGDSDLNMTSYLDYVAVSHHVAERASTVEEEQELPEDADYIMETSFFSSVGSSRASGLHPSHESAFTPLRFTFGMDGAGFSRPLDLSSPVPEVADIDSSSPTPETEHVDDSKQPQLDADSSLDEIDNQAFTMEQYTRSSALEGGAEDGLQLGQTEPIPVTISTSTADQTRASEAVVLSSDSDSDSDGSEESEIDHDTLFADVSGHNNDGLVEVAVDHAASSDIEPDEPGRNQDHQPDLDHATSQSPRVPNTLPIVTGYEAPHDHEVVPVISVSMTDIDSDDVQQDIDQAISVVHTTFTPEISTEVTSQSEEGHQSMDLENYSECVDLNFAPESLNAVPTSEDGTSAQTSLSQPLESSAHAFEVNHSELIDNRHPGMTEGDIDDHMEDVSSLEPASHVPDEHSFDEDMHHPDVKLESIEDNSLSTASSVKGEDVQSETSAQFEGELTIAIPDEGDKLGELHTITVPATGPARNTRSQLDISISPNTDEKPKRITRSARSEAPVTRVTTSSTDIQTHSSVSDSQDAMQTSPYSLRSQSLLLSPTKNTPVVATTGSHRMSHKQGSHRGLDLTSEAGPSQLDNGDYSMVDSQDSNASQGRQVNDRISEDTDDETSRTERSTSNGPERDDSATLVQHQAIYSVPIEQASKVEAHLQLNPLPALALEQRTRSRAKVTARTGKSQVMGSSSPVQTISVSNTQTPTKGSHRRLRSSRSVVSPTPSPTILRHPKQPVHDLSPKPEGAWDDLAGQSIPMITQTPSALLSDDEGESGSEGEGNQSGRSPPKTAVELMRTFPLATLSPPRKQRSTRSNRLITPEATQQSALESQSSSTAAHHRQDLPMTPQLTQVTSAGLRSFHTNDKVDLDVTVVTVTTELAPATKSTPRRGVTTTDVASTSASPEPKDPSSDIDDDTASEHPSIGLSTPLAYYTPLKDLMYFLNRSSQFHSSTNPDVLALVTSSTTTSERAKKGAKHWNTTLHITDASTWPATTTVQIFRAYQTALPHAEVGDVILLRAFVVKSLNRHPSLISADESAWCVWRYGKPVWGTKKGTYGEIRAREEVNGPVVERGEGEWSEVEKVRGWFVSKVKAELEEKENEGVKTRSRDKAKADGDGEV